MGILSHFPDMDKAPGEGNFPSSNILDSTVVFTTPVASVMSHSYTSLCTMAMLSGYFLVVCGKSCKENACWQLVPPLFLQLNHVLMG